MGGVYCRKCGEPWDFYYVSHEMSPAERSDFVRGLCCPKCRARTPPDVTEKEKALASIIEVLGEIELMVKRLETISPNGSAIHLPEGANRALEYFFFSCQVAEERIKTAAKKNYITVTQVTALNNELHENVRKMLRVTARSPPLTHAMQALLDTNDPVIKDLITQST